jgi:hypothetical protein
MCEDSAEKGELAADLGLKRERAPHWQGAILDGSEAGGLKLGGSQRAMEKLIQLS